VIDLTGVAAWKCEVCHHWIGARNNAPPTILRVAFREFVTTDAELVPTWSDTTTIVACRACLNSIEWHDSVQHQ